MSENIEISIIMPCLNEAETLALCINEAQQAIWDIGVNAEIIIADNGSTDASIDIAKQLGARVVHISEKGYGSALQGGIAAARGKYVLMGDSDYSYSFAELPHYLEKLREGYDLVMGCRFPRCGGKIETGAMPFLHRWLGNPVLSGIGKLFFSSAIDDFHCGLRAFNRKAILALDLTTTGMEFASEMVVKASLYHLKITQVAITLRKDKRSRAPHLRSWRDGWRHLRFMLLFTPNWLFILPGILLTLTGLLGTCILLPKALQIGSITLDLNSLLVCNAMLVSGVQILFFGIFIKVYAASMGLLNQTRWLQFARSYPVEWGIVLGLCLLFTGIGLIFYAVMQWQDTGFGVLPYQDSLRLVIPGCSAIIMGLQIFFAGFALAILGMKK